MTNPDSEANLAAIERDGSIHDVPALVEFLPPESHGLGGPALRALDAVFRRAQPAAIAQLDAGFRGYGALAPKVGRAWQDLAIARAPWDRRDVALVALATMHSNGFVRQNAVERLAATRDSLGLPFLLLRANDWNENVARVAFTALASWSTASFAAEWLRCMPLLTRRTHESRQQAALSRLCASVERMLRGTETRVALRGAIRDSDASVAWHAVRIASACAEEDVLPILREALHTPSSRVVLSAARALVARDAVDLEEMASHSNARVRVLGLETAARRLGISAKPFLEPALFDANATVRAVARYELSRNGLAREWATVYREAIAASGHLKASAADGLAETGAVDDIGAFRAWLTHPVWRVRVAGLRGLARVDPSGNLATFEAALKDVSSHVRRAARPIARLYVGRSALRST